ncbi:MAG TPA: flavin reductase family protein [Thermoanaerobaculia bacterium]|nr:flavin reductase family protein [Thermoanaerobaculia bacterium]
MPITSDQFRQALAHFPAGVTIVTVRTGDRVHGLTVSAFNSVSTEPPLVVVVIDRRHRAAEMFDAPDASFAVNILSEDQSELSNRFAWVKDEDRFAQGTWERAATGAPVLTDALSWLDCSIAARYPAGTHTIYLGLVEASAVPNPGLPPLLYWHRGYRKIKLLDGDG